MSSTSIFNKLLFSACLISASAMATQYIYPNDTAVAKVRGEHISCLPSQEKNFASTCYVDASPAENSKRLNLYIGCRKVADYPRSEWSIRLIIPGAESSPVKLAAQDLVNNRSCESIVEVDPKVYQFLSQKNNCQN